MSDHYDTRHAWTTVDGRHVIGDARKPPSSTTGRDVAGEHVRELRDRIHQLEQADALRKIQAQLAQLGQQPTEPKPAPTTPPEVVTTSRPGGSADPGLTVGMWRRRGWR